MTLADCFFTMILILLPTGNDSKFDALQVQGACTVADITFLIVSHHRLKVSTSRTIYFIPLPQRTDTIRLSYKMQNAYAYLGDCAYGLTAYTYKESSCQKVMVRFGPHGTY